MTKNWPLILGATALPNVGGIVGGIFSRREVKSWYETLKKPDWRPPNKAFGPVWTALYSGMGYASYLVYKEGGGFSGEYCRKTIFFDTCFFYILKRTCKTATPSIRYQLGIELGVDTNFFQCKTFGLGLFESISLHSILKLISVSRHFMKLHLWMQLQSQLHSSSSRLIQLPED